MKWNIHMLVSLPLFSLILITTLSFLWETLLSNSSPPTPEVKSCFQLDQVTLGDPVRLHPIARTME